MYDLIVLGGGPAGLAAAMFAASKRLNYKIVCGEVGGKIGWLEQWGGPATQPVAGAELAQLLASHTALPPEAVLLDQVRSVRQQDDLFQVMTERHGVLESTTLIVATGATPLQLNVAGARRFIGSGICYSITTYAHLAKDRRVAVVGGSARALSGAAELARTAKQLFVIAPGSGPARTPLAVALRHQPHVAILEQTEVTGVLGHGTVEGLALMRAGVPEQLDVDVIFVALGLNPNSELVRGLVDTDPQGFILVNAFYETSLPGVFAAGDVSSMFSEHTMTAIGDGTRAAMSAHDYLLARWLLPDQAETAL